MRQVRIFVSSPGDAQHERRRVDRVVERLNGEFAGIARLSSIRWETEFYQAHATFQEQIPEAQSCDIVVAIFRTRLGTELPPDFVRMPDGAPYPSGTAYEVLSAIEARRRGVTPDVYVFRHPEPPTVRLDDPEAVRVGEQWQRLKSFFDTWFVASEGPFKAAFQTFATTDDFEIQLDRLLRQWLEEKVLGGRAVLWPVATKGSPFRGLAAFGARHAAVFFGRSRDIARAIDAWKEARDRGAAFLLVVGPSGAGKSSLARAGLVPRLSVPGVVPEVDLWRAVVMRPTEIAGGPVLTLATRLLDAAGAVPEDDAGRAGALPELADSDYRTPAELAALLRHADSASIAPLVRALDRIGESERTRQGYDRPVRVDLVLLVDQLDELFGPDVDAEEAALFARLLAALTESGRVWIVATLRADLYEPYLAEPTLLALKTQGSAYDLAPPGSAELAEIVRRPAAAAELVFEVDPATGEGLDERLLREADRPDMLPLLQLALNRLFEGRVAVGGETRLTLAAYEALGGLAGVIDREAEQALSGLGEREVAALPRLLRRLAAVTRAEGGGPTSLTIRTVPLALFDEPPDGAEAGAGKGAQSPARRLVRALVDARILLSTGEGDAASVHLAHQRVLTDWARARAQIAADAEFYRIRDEVEDQRRRWLGGKRRSDLLIPHGLALAEAESIASRFGDELGRETSGFVALSGRRARVRQRLVAAAAVLFALVAIGATGAGIVAFGERREALVERQKALHETARAVAEAGRAERTLDAAKLAVHGLIFDIAQGLRSVEGMRAATIHKVLERVRQTIDRLAQDAPNDTALRINRAVMFDEFAQTYLTAGDLAAARKSDDSALAILRPLVAQDPKNGKLQDDLDIILSRIGDIRLAAGDAKGALDYERQALAVIAPLAAREPGDRDFQRDLAATTSDVADLELRRGNAAAARTLYDKCAAILRRLASDKSDTRSQRDLAVTLGRIADLNDRSGNAAAALASYREGLSVARALAARDPGNAEWSHDVAVALERVGDVSIEISDVAAARAAYDEERTILRRLNAQDPGNTSWQRDLSLSLERKGDLALRGGDSRAAIAAYDEEMGFLRRLVGHDPTNADWQRDLAIGLERRADAAAATGDDAGALAGYREGLAIRRTLAARDPTDTTWQQDLSVSLERIGDFELRTGDVAGARAAYAQDLAIYRRLVARDAGNASWQFGLALGLERSGDLARRADDAKAALAAYAEEDAIFRKLVHNDPENTGLQRGLTVALEKTAIVKNSAGDTAGALADYTEVLTIRRGLVARDPTNAGWQNDLAVVLVDLGDMRHFAHDDQGALADYQEALALRRGLVAHDKANADWQYWLAQTLEKLGDAKILTGDPAAALAFYQEGAATARSLLARDATNPDWRRVLAVGLAGEGDVWERQGNVAKMIPAYREATAIQRDLAGRDPTDPEGQRVLAASLERFAGAEWIADDNAVAIAGYREAIGIYGRLAASEPGNRAWPLAAALDRTKLGEVLVGTGAVAQAQAAFADGMAGLDTLARANTDNPAAQRELATTYGGIGDIHVAAGQKADAAAAYVQASAALRRVVAHDPGDSASAIGLALLLGKLGNAEEPSADGKTGDRAAATAAYRESAAIFGRAAAAQKANGVLQRALSVALNKLGDSELAAGDVPGALATYKQSFAVIAPLAAADPGRQRDLAVTWHRIGAAEIRAGDPKAALPAYTASLAIRRHLARAAPASPPAQREAAVEAIAVGDLDLALADTEGARAAYAEDIAILRRQSARDPGDGEWQRDLVIGLVKLSGVASGADRKAALDEALTIAVRLQSQGQLSGLQVKWPDMLRQELARLQPVPPTP